MKLALHTLTLEPRPLMVMARCHDNIAGEGEVDTQTPGSYSLAYNFEDADGKKAETLTRTVVVVDTTPPVITLGEFDGDLILSVSLRISNTLTPVPLPRMLSMGMS